MRGTMSDRLWSHIDKRDDPGACWPWMGGMTKGGYGVFWDGNRMTTAHRVVLRLRLARPLRDGMLACHTCDNPPCCNPSHLFEGTYGDNLEDMRRKGRRKRTGPPGGTLDANRVREIRALRQDGWSQQAIADEFGVSQTTVSRVLLGQIWSHVPNLPHRS